MSTAGNRPIHPVARLSFKEGTPVETVMMCMPSSPVAPVLLEARRIEVAGVETDTSSTTREERCGRRVAREKAPERVTCSPG